MFKKYKISFLLTILIILGFLFYNNRVVIKEYFFEPEKIELPEEIKFEDFHGDIIEEDLILEDKDVDVEFVETQGIASSPVNENNNVEEINLAVPFTIQSPDQKWELPFKEGCEEAVILMVYNFLNDKQITINSALNDIQEMVDWQIENYKGHFDLSATTTAELAKNIYGLDTKIIELSSIDNIKEVLKTGYPLILPCAGIELKNPNFRQPGPLYHMLIVKGFTKDGLIITNDPGTRKGKDYVYQPDVLWNAIADWNKEIKNPDQNEKVGIIIKK